MPIYEYRCSDCGHRLEALQRFADKPLLVCPACGKESLTKLISAVGFQLKGSGWYATDFKHSGSKPPEKSAAKGDASGDSGNGGAKAEGSSATASSGDSKSDAKPSAPPSSSASDSKTASAESKPAPAAKPAATGS